MDDVPSVSYARTPDGAAVAYQVWGHGPVDILHIPSFPASVDSQWEHPGHVRSMQSIGRAGRAISVDFRGSGRSDPLDVGRIGELQEAVTDILCVLDAAGCDRVAALAEGTSGQAAIAFAAEHPDRVLRLALANTMASGLRQDDYPWGLPGGVLGAALDDIRARWGTGELVAANSRLASDPGFLRFCARFERAGGPPSLAAAWFRASVTNDVRHLLGAIDVPTLVMFTGDIGYIGVEHSRYIAEHIPGAEFVEAPGGTTFYDPEVEGRGNLLLDFLAGGMDAVASESILATVLFTDIAGSTQRAARVGDDRWSMTLDHLDACVAREAERRQGVVRKQTGDGHLLTFASPRSAARAAQEIVRQAAVLGVELRAGAHIGEVELRANGDVTGTVVNTAARVMDRAGPGEVWVSRTLADLLAGSSVDLVDRGTHSLKGLAGQWQLFEVGS